MNKYTVFSICFLLIFVILLFSGFTHTSVYHGLVTLWVVIFSALLAAKSECTKRSDSTSNKKYYYASLFLIFMGIILSVLMMVLVNNPPKNSRLIAKLVITGFNSLVALLVIAKLIFRWRKLNTTFIVASFIAIFVLVTSIVFFWLIW